MGITIAGLGPGSVEDLTHRSWRALTTAQRLYLRTAHHGCVAAFPPSLHYESFDALYERHDRFEDVYRAIIDALMAAAREGDLVYAVPGDPLVGEATTTGLLEAAREAGIAIEIVSGVSFVEPLLALLGVDALDGLQLLDGLQVAAMHHPPINPAFPALLAQVYSAAVASDIKLTLMNQYPDDFGLQLVHGAGTADARVEALPLHALDRSKEIGAMTALYLPALGEHSSFESAQEIIAHLRAPEGCPWDREQTHESLRRFLIEEAWEVLEAIEEGDAAALAEELGDLLLQIVLHAQIATEEGRFRMSDVLQHIIAKMIRRHPHVWGDVDVQGDPDAVLRNWEELKRAEKAAVGVEEGFLLDSLPRGMPALLEALRLQERAAKVNFDWPHQSQVLDKLREELKELQVAQGDVEREHELGDLLFTLVNLARWMKLEPEGALRAANARFRGRFRYVEERARDTGQPLNEHSLAQLDALWNEAKQAGL
ncbi:MAG: nucleoside triphosphate pyrophosphohydrolase [Anaerolineaceae bacterium]|nr:nucleoside triphosphate pyrophosphohydrolase [Anaerolineaceae bacterium]